MKVGKLYQIIKKIKIHTSPLVTVEVTQIGRFVKETYKFYMFDTFRVMKSCVVSVEEV